MLNIEEFIPVALGVAKGYNRYKYIDAKSLALMGLVVAVTRLSDTPHPEPLAYIRITCHSFIRNAIKADMVYTKHCKKFGRSCKEGVTSYNYTVDDLVQWLDISNDERAILIERLKGSSIKEIAKKLNHGSHFVSLTLGNIARKVKE